MVQLLVVTLLSCAAASGKHELWRWPFAPSPYVVEKNPRDNLPDFSLDGDSAVNFTSKTLACPAPMQRPCCGAPHGGDEACGPKSCTTRPCANGLYCANFANAAKWNTTQYLPHMNGSTAAHRPALNRTRRNILQRAVGWLATHAPYLKCHTPGVKYGLAEACAADDEASCPRYGHTGSCEGYVGMAHGAPGYDDEGDRTVIPCAEMLPGDGCFHHDKFPGGGVNHVWLFREWANPGNTTLMRLYQMGGGGGAVNMKTQTKQTKDCGVAKKGPCIVCFKYSHIVDEASDVDAG